MGISQSILIPRVFLSLNNDHARAILSPPPPPGKKEKYPPILSGGVGTRKIKLIHPANVREKLELPVEVKEVDLSKIWHHFYSMHLIAVEDKNASPPYAGEEILR
jgi:hypothetical protein